MRERERERERKRERERDRERERGSACARDLPFTTLPLPALFCMSAIICLQSCSFPTELLKRNPFQSRLPSLQIPERSSYTMLRGIPPGKQSGRLFRHQLAPTMTCRKRPRGYFRPFRCLFRTEREVGVGEGEGEREGGEFVVLRVIICSEHTHTHTEEACIGEL